MSRRSTTRTTQRDARATSVFEPSDSFPVEMERRVRKK
jgi:hypothetical protein